MENWEFVFWGGLAYVVSFCGSLALVALVIVALPPRYFLERPERQLWVDRHPAVRIVLHILKNLIGAALVVAGILLSLPGIPGQGLLTIVIGLLLMDFPGKVKLERKLVSQPRVLAAINRIRRRFGKCPLVMDDSGKGESGKGR